MRRSAAAWRRESSSNRVKPATALSTSGGRSGSRRSITFQPGIGCAIIGRGEVREDTVERTDPAITQYASDVPTFDAYEEFPDGFRSGTRRTSLAIRCGGTPTSAKKADFARYSMA